MKKLAMIGLGVGLTLAVNTAAFAEDACGRLFNGQCFEKLKAVDCYLTPFIFDDNENVIGGGDLICTGAVSGDTPPIIVQKEHLKTVPDGHGGVTTYYSAKRVAKFKAGSQQDRRGKKNREIQKAREH